MDVVPSLDPGSPRVRFGVEMRRLREAAQLSQAAVASRLGCTQTQVSRLEKATRTPSRSDAERLDRLFGTANGVSFIRLHQRIITQPGGPTWFRSWAEEVEPTARVLRSWDPLLVPGLLQTESYARYVLSQEPRITSEDVEERVQARIQRRQILEGDAPPLLLALIDAGVLRRPVGDPAVMREQLDYLLEIEKHPSVFIQLVDQRCLSGLLGAFMIAELPNGQPDAIHSDSSTEGKISTDSELVASIWNRYEAIRRWAYPDHMSLKMIEDARQEWT
ncbi:transcriptional regulator with XRE-family HTH domain [Streptosporangium becharense]|uniref:Transcriptional regulator with XRE-family HTH domain n=1 Tax=Streptosporangium becharense TaxID=1816182 RepID=A0A7W9MJ59_9ACTN|nr:helix-turn-helix transcriptional regulator [Streptosporangium becharense]MBB2913255.1 transcriptional regulator with XRE-family HTH domain [Streptosporangium becharense]MBB5822238.1 transcriptional regulator with XRE-family HTH domain [Streptosporangium becharense]